MGCKSAFEPSVLSSRSLFRFSVALSDYKYFYSPLDGMLVHRRVTPSIKFAGSHLYTSVERGTTRVQCLAQEHNTMTPARARTTVPPTERYANNKEVSSIVNNLAFQITDTSKLVLSTVFGTG